MGGQELVDQLVKSFREQVRRSLSVTLDGSTTSLAFVDHHLKQARTEDRNAVLGLLAAGAGAYYGEIVRTEMGGTWVGDGQNPRQLRLLLAPQFVYFSPVDQAIEAIVGESLSPEDPRVPEGPPLDVSFHLKPVRPNEIDDETHDANWLRARLAEVPPVAEDEYHSLTCRFETLQFMLGLLASKHFSEGRTPTDHGLDEYVAILAETRTPPTLQ